MHYYLFLCLFILWPTVSPASVPPIQLATIYRQDINIDEYWVSEKLDGVRAYWDGKQLISRQGNVFSAPQWFIKDFPSVPLDGELWIARDKFAQVSGIARTHNGKTQEWEQISFMIFDLPASLANFSQRIKLISRLVKQSSSPYLKMIPQHKITDNTKLQILLEEVIASGGEGLMLHKGSAYYQVKRSQDLMKLKKYEDAEAVVRKHIPGKGRNSGRMGSLLVETESGILFKIGTGFSDIERENPPEIGAIITYKFIGKTKNNVPRFASFMRIRESY
ncbi:DNA ligase [Psychromonas ossibalaenae]|uniref:DNA ligase n=1 Tax=Psychromonas ossibalaenae TaxID=444922 RepID=UPI000366C816|nr:DNA ligase [Psychromonas ossibalaenae]